MFAAYNGHDEICRLLLEYNSDSSIKTINGKTAIILAHDAKYTHVANLIENFNNNNINNNNNNNYENYNKPTPPLPPPHRSNRTSFQRTPERIPTAMTQQPIESNFTNQNLYPEIPINNNSKGYLMPLNRRDSKRTKLQRKNHESQYFNNIIKTNNNNDTDGGKFHVKTAPHLKNDMAPRENKTPWVIFSLIVTACFCNPCLSIIGNMKDPNVRQAWREKVALVIIILLISLFMGFLAFGLAAVTCGIRKQSFYKEDVLKNF